MTSVLFSFFLLPLASAPLAATYVASTSMVTQAKEETPKPKKATDKKKTEKKADFRAVDDEKMKLLKTLDSTFQTKALSMKVDKTTKIPILEQEKKSSGKMFVANGRLRLELDGTEKSLLVVNKKNLWAVTFPGAEFKDAPVQVIKGDTSSKKGRSSNFVSLLAQGGFLKFFTATGSQAQPNGDVLIFLAPKKDTTDFKRAQVKVSADGEKITGLNYWDDRDNETRFEFSDVKVESKLEDKLFQYAPPANADIMTL